jgi:hypothetical protein
VNRLSEPDTHLRLLVLTYHFPRDGSVGGLRWAGLTKYLAPLGWTSTVVTAAHPYQGPETIGARITSVSRSRTLSDMYRWLSRADARDRRPADGQAPVVVARDGFWKRLRREVDTLLWMPDDSRGWILRAAVRLRRTIRSTDPHVVVSSGPPHGAHLAAWLATRGTNVPWLADLRDPWAFLVWPGHRQVESRLACAGARRLERLVATRCAGMIATTPVLVGALAERYPHTNVTWIPNGVDRELLPYQDAPPFSGFSLAHVGSLYGRRDITPVLRAMSALFMRQPEARSDSCTIHLVGEMDWPQREALGRAAGELGLGASIKMYGAVPRTAALRVLARSHVAIVAAQGQDMMIPAKLYEAIAISRVVLVLAPSTSATGIEAARLGARVVDPENLDLLSRELESLWAQRHQPAGLASAGVGYDAVARQVDEVLRSASKRCPAQP